MFIDIAFNIIDMNGRVYDPLAAQFLSPDPYVQAPDNWLNYNRYAYCYGNPLMYTDPTGEQGSNVGWILDDAGFPISIKSLLITGYSADWEMYEQGRYYFGSDGRFMFYAPLPEDYAFAYITPTFEVRPPMTYQPYEPLDNYENIVNGYDPAVGGYSYMGEVGESIGSYANEVERSESANEWFTAQNNTKNSDETAILAPEHFIGPTLVASGQPWIPKNSSFAKSIFSRSASVMGTKQLNTSFASLVSRRISNTFGLSFIGGQIGRAVPYVGWALTYYDGITISFRLGQEYGPSKWYGDNDTKWFE